MEFELTDTERMLRDTFRGYFTREIEPHVPKMESGEMLPYRLMRDMHLALGLEAMLPQPRKPDTTGAERSGTAGLGLDANAARYARTAFMVEMSRVSPSFTLSYGASVGLFAGNVVGKGTPEQIERFALPVMRCERVGAWALTEPGAGSDALRGMKTTARRDGDVYVLNGSKTFITNAPHADIFLIYARVHGGELDGSIQPFIAERGLAGLSTGPAMKKMGMRGSPTGEVFLDDVRISADQLLGGGVRQRDHVKASLSTERGGLSIISYGIAERCFEIARDYARQRHQFGQPIANYQLIPACAHVRGPVQLPPHRLRRLPGRAHAARVRCRRVRRQALLRRDGHLRCLRSDPHPRRQRLHGGVRGGAPGARRQTH
jgi:alkylation response protein AidB-like acyl-CoA dehydrogenase